MQLKICATDIWWWFWAATLAFIIGALTGWTPGYYVVMGISAVQVIFFLAQEKSLAAFPAIWAKKDRVVCLLPEVSI
jgi:hypothetical protein